MENATVDYLFKNTGKEWDNDIINDLFDKRDADLILSIPLSRELCQDKLIWGFESNGKFSVKSCYKALIGELAANNVVRWAGIWKLEIPPKSKIFLWQVCTNSLPTALNLRKKHVDCPITCILCQKEYETAKHLFADCDLAKAVWRNLNYTLPQIGVSTAAEWITASLTSLDKQSSHLLVTCCWSIWKARNDMVWNHKTTSPDVIIERAKAYLQDWRNFAAADSHINQLAHPTLQTWEKPMNGWFKMNIDVALDYSRGVTGFGWIVRDDKGSFIAAKCLSVRGTYQPKEAEAIAVSEALSWLKTTNMDKVQLETDSLLVSGQ